MKKTIRITLFTLALLSTLILSSCYYVLSVVPTALLGDAIIDSLTPPSSNSPIPSTPTDEHTHTAGEWIVDIAPTSNAEGKKHQSCIFCEQVMKVENIAPTGSLGLAYTVNEDGVSCTIIGIGECKDTHIYIPEKIDGYTVTAIGDSAFLLNYGIVEVVIPDSVLSIGELAFSDCISLTSVSLPKDLSAILHATFSSCVKLKSIEIPEGVTEIGAFAFVSCSALESITLPEGVESIGYAAFSLCESLQNISLPNSLRFIGMDAFRCCYDLESITIPANVTYVGYGAFVYCISLQEISVAKENTHYKTIDGNLYTKDAKNLLCYLPSNEAEIFYVPNGVKVIGSYAFAHCNKLKSIILPNSVETLQTHAFYYLAYLESITLSKNLYLIEYEAFVDCCRLTDVTLPSSLIILYEYAFSWCNALDEIVFEGTMKQLYDTLNTNADLGKVFPGMDTGTIHCADGDIVFERSDWHGK